MLQISFSLKSFKEIYRGLYTCVFSETMPHIILEDLGT